jgi:hypothetical protein
LTRCGAHCQLLNGEFCMANRNRRKKPGSGRKAAQREREIAPASTRKQSVPANAAKRATAEQILGVQDECELWDRLLHSEDDRVAFAALKYLTDRRDGKLYPAVNGSLGSQSFGNPQFREDSHLADPKITAALLDLLPPPSPAVTVGDGPGSP